jgi:MoaA/NifB/PqqE/SkfB family radical SAM enzyme
MLIPKQIDIEVTSACNLKCKFCPTLSEYHKPEHIDPEFFKSIIDRVDFKTVIVPWLNGEPLLHPDYAELTKYISKAKIPFYTTTNATIWNDEFFEHITDNDTMCYQLIFSLDGLWDTNSIEKARPATNRKVVRENIERFIKLKNKKNPNLDLCLKICKRGQDYEEFEDYIDYWLNTEGVDFVCVGSPLVDDNVDNMRTYPCQYSDNNFMVIKPDRRVCFCAYNDEMTNNHDNKVGILDYKSNLLDFYNNEKFTEFRENQRKGIFHPVCQTCGFAYTGHGFEGVIYFRKHPERKVFYHQDYYNQFFSFKQKWKPLEYYKQGYKEG